MQSLSIYDKKNLYTPCVHLSTTTSYRHSFQSYLPVLDERAWRSSPPAIRCDTKVVVSGTEMKVKWSAFPVTEQIVPSLSHFSQVAITLDYRHQGGGRAPI